MSTLLTALISISFIGLLAISIYRFIKFKNIRDFILHLVSISICFIFLYYFFLSSHEPIERGGNKEIYFVIVLYLFMLLGMLAQYIYAYLERPKRYRRKFDLGLFVAPIFTSPIVFVPLLAALQNSVVDLDNLTTTKMMIFLVAFENGFFWKDYFDNRRELKKEKIDE